MYAILYSKTRTQENCDLKKNENRKELTAISLRTNEGVIIKNQLVIAETLADYFSTAAINIGGNHVKDLVQSHHCNHISVTSMVNKDYKNIEIQIDVQIIINTNHIRLLGVDIDESINFTYHISELCKKTSRKVGVLMRLRNLIPGSAILTIYKSSILPYLTYCHVVWHFCKASDSRKLLNGVGPSKKRILDVPESIDRVDPVSLVFIKAVKTTWFNSIEEDEEKRTLEATDLAFHVLRWNVVIKSGCTTFNKFICPSQQANVTKTGYMPICGKHQHRNSTHLMQLLKGVCSSLASLVNATR
ncbi:Hypothetical predicted protein [Paramuricea clavata]|uniref:Uncharacterized protein n=1 Tax=Paramuricea clavata TaxID=317549 RepID=A0A7D9DF88_PARCT|nr:Hypothetical predicted protein [Paramuricea clavata]